MDRFHGILGILIILGIAYALSTDRKRIKPRIVIFGLALQLLFGLVGLPSRYLDQTGEFSHSSTGPLRARS